MRYILMVLIMWFLAVVQSVYFSVAYPTLYLLSKTYFVNLPLLALVVFCFFLLEKNIVWVAIIAGIIVDIAFSSWLGLHTFVYGFIAYWSLLVFRHILERNFFVYLMAVIVSFLLYYALVIVINGMFGLLDYEVSLVFDKFFFGGLLLTIVTAIVIYNPIKIFYASRGVTLDAS